MPIESPGWYIKYKVLYPNVTLTSKYFAEQVNSGLTPSINVSVLPSTTSGTVNETVTFNVTVNSNLKFGEIPVTIIIYQYLMYSNSLYKTYVLHFNFFNIPSNGFLVNAKTFNNITTIGKARFGNISILNSNIPSSILSIIKGSNNVQILFNDSFTGLISFQTNVTPLAIYADGQKLSQGYYTVPSNIPLGSWSLIGNTVYINADPANVTVVYNTSTQASSTTSSSLTTSSSSTNTGYVSQFNSFYNQHKDLVLVSITFLFIVIIVAVLLYRR